MTKDVTYYEKELKQWKATLEQPDTSENTAYNLKKQIAENERTIESVQIQMTTFLDQLEDNMGKFLALNAELNAGDVAFVLQNTTYTAAVALLEQLEQQYALGVKQELIIKEWAQYNFHLFSQQ